MPYDHIGRYIPEPGDIVDVQWIKSGVVRPPPKGQKRPGENWIYVQFKHGALWLSPEDTYQATGDQA